MKLKQKRCKWNKIKISQFYIIFHLKWSKSNHKPIVKVLKPIFCWYTWKWNWNQQEASSANKIIKQIINHFNISLVLVTFVLFAFNILIVDDSHYMKYHVRVNIFLSYKKHLRCDCFFSPIIIIIGLEYDTMFKKKGLLKKRRNNFPLLLAKNAMAGYYLTVSF